MTKPRPIRACSGLSLAGTISKGDTDLTVHDITREERVTAA